MLIYTHLPRSLSNDMAKHNLASSLPLTNGVAALADLDWLRHLIGSEIR